jgi:hypothetical protein
MAIFRSDRVTYNQFTGQPVYAPRFVYEAVSSDTSMVTIPPGTVLATGDSIELCAVGANTTLLDFHLVLPDMDSGTGLVMDLEAVTPGPEDPPFFSLPILQAIPGGQSGAVLHGASPGVNRDFFGFHYDGTAPVVNGVLREDMRPLVVRLRVTTPAVGTGALEEPVRFILVAQSGYGPREYGV